MDASKVETVQVGGNPTPMVKMKAKSFGNVVGEGGVLHFDPEGSDPLSRVRFVHVGDVEKVLDAGIADYAEKSAEVEVRQPGLQPEAVVDRALGNAKLEPELGSSTLPMRDTTAFPPAQGVDDPELGYVDDDVPAAPTKRKAAATTTNAS